MSPIVGIFIVLISFLIMEGITWLTHRFVMHGFLWRWHRDHHQPGYGKFEKNDRFFLVFSIPSMVLIGLGTLGGIEPLLFIGLGIFCYGMAYFFVHDIFIHQRLKWFSRSEVFYLRALRKAHKVHHKHLGKEEGECFGMLWVPLKYFREQLGRKS